MITKSIAIDRKNAGMVIFVGNAARFVTSDMVIEAIAAIKKTKLCVVAITTIAVSGVITQPCPVIAIANHASLFLFWFSVQVMKEDNSEGR